MDSFLLLPPCRRQLIYVTDRQLAAEDQLTQIRRRVRIQAAPIHKYHILLPLHVVRALLVAGRKSDLASLGNFHLCKGAERHGDLVYHAAFAQSRVRHYGDLRLDEIRIVAAVIAYHRLIVDAGEVWLAGDYDDDTFTYDAKYNYYGLDATGQRTTVNFSNYYTGAPVSGPVFNWNNVGGGSEKTKVHLGNVHSGHLQNTTLKIEFDIRGVAKMRNNPVLPSGNYVATHEIWCIQ